MPASGLPAAGRHRRLCRAIETLKRARPDTGPRDRRPEILFLLSARARRPIEVEARRRPNVRTVACKARKHLPLYPRPPTSSFPASSERWSGSEAASFRSRLSPYLGRAARSWLLAPRPHDLLDDGRNALLVSPPTREAAAALDRFSATPLSREALAKAPRRPARGLAGRRAAQSPASCAGGCELSRPNRRRRCASRPNSKGAAQAPTHGATARAAATASTPSPTMKAVPAAIGR